jgi:hypothetical protein
MATLYSVSPVAPVVLETHASYFIPQIISALNGEKNSLRMHCWVVDGREVTVAVFDFTEGYIPPVSPFASPNPQKEAPRFIYGDEF